MRQIKGTVVCSGRGSGIAVQIRGLEESRNFTGELVVTDRMPPSKFILRYRKNLRGVIIDRREYEKFSHSVVLLREYQIPLVVLSQPLHIAKGSVVEIDDGDIYIGRTKKPVVLTEKGGGLQAPGEAETPDGRSVTLLSTVWDLEGVAEASKTDTSGIGVFRTEGITLEGIPGFAKQLEIYRRTLQLMGGREVYFRLFDFCEDKIWFENADLYEIYFTQLCALCCAAAEVEYINVLLPNVNHTMQLRGMVRLANRAADRLRADKRPAGRLRFGSMIETAQAAMVACEICAVSDFVAVGLNGLSRMSGDFPLFGEEYNERALLRVCKLIMSEAEKLGCQLTFCGDLLGSHEMLTNLIGLGARRIAVAPKRAQRAALTISHSSYYSSIMTALDRSGKFITREDAEEPCILASGC